MSGEMAAISAQETALFLGDLAKLTAPQRQAYAVQVCESLGLNPLTRPLDYITLNGKLTLYATRACTDQLRKLHGVSICGLQEEVREGVYIVTATATDKAGRRDMAKGAVTIAGLKGDALANALMKAETKAKRRVTLSLCGLGYLDETELATVQDVRPAPVVETQPAIEHKPNGDSPGDPPVKGDLKPPQSGKELYQRLVQKQAQLEGAGKLPAGSDALLEYVISAGVEREWPADLGQWDAAQAKAGYAWARDWVRQRELASVSAAAAANVQA